MEPTEWVKVLLKGVSGIEIELNTTSLNRRKAKAKRKELKTINE